MRTAVITGGAAGLGADVARRLSESGYRVGIFDLGADRVAQTASELDNAVGIEADVTSPEQIAAAFEAFGETPDLLVNNAGIVRFGAMEAQSARRLHRRGQRQSAGELLLCARDRARHDGREARAISSTLRLSTAFTPPRGSDYTALQRQPWPT